MRFGNFIEQAEQEQEDPKAKRLKMIKRQVLQKKVQAVRQGAGEDIVASHEPEGEMVEGVGDAVKKGLKRHKDAVEKKKIADRKAVPYQAMAASYTPQGDVLGEEGYDRMRDDRLVKYGIGHDGSDRKSTPSRRTPDNQKIKGKTVLQKETEKKYGKGVSAIDVVRKKIEAKHGKGAIMDTKKKN